MLPDGALQPGYGLYSVTHKGVVVDVKLHKASHCMPCMLPSMQMVSCMQYCLLLLPLLPPPPTYGACTILPTSTSCIHDDPRPANSWGHRCMLMACSVPGCWLITWKPTPSWFPAGKPFTVDQMHADCACCAKVHCPPF